MALRLVGFWRSPQFMIARRVLKLNDVQRQAIARMINRA
jgi:hypothetical protein